MRRRFTVFAFLILVVPFVPSAAADDTCVRVNTPPDDPDVYHGESCGTETPASWDGKRLWICPPHSECMFVEP